jgi:hypothetical protein
MLESDSFVKAEPRAGRYDGLRAKTPTGPPSQEEGNMEYHDLVNVYSARDTVQAEIIRNYLQSEGIRCVVDGANAASQMPIGAFEIRLLVEAGNADKARKLIDAQERHARH